MKNLLRPFVLLALAGCGSLGNSGDYSPQVLNGGAGPFRLGTRVEMGYTSGPIGLVLDVGESVGRSAHAGDALFYDGAVVLAAPPVHDPGLQGWEVDWNQYEPRAIFRTTTHVVDAMGVTRQGFAAGSPVLSPTEAWEASGVYDPAILRMPSGAVRLYYATSQGIGVAEAPAIDGAFTRLVTSPILADVAGHGAAESPAVVMLPNGDTMLYVGADGMIWAARSTDGLTFTLVDGDTTTAPIDAISLPIAVADADAGTPGPDASVVTEVAIHQPTALTARTSTGRFVVRLYFVSERSDGTRVLAVAGSFDGEVFDRSSIVPYAKNNPVHPSIFLRDDGITLITFAVARLGGGTQSAVPVLGLTPSELPFPAP